MKVVIGADAQGYLRGMNTAAAGTRRFSAGIRGEFERVKGTLGSLKGILAGIGVTVGGIKLAVDTAQFERDMRRLQVNLGASRAEMEAWRSEAYDNQKRYGTLLTDQKELAESLQAAGLDITAIRGAAEPVSKTLQVAKTNADQLGKALGVAREQFGIDITDKAAVEGLLDRMVVAGRLGNRSTMWTGCATSSTSSTTSAPCACCRSARNTKMPPIRRSRSWKPAPKTGHAASRG